MKDSIEEVVDILSKKGHIVEAIGNTSDWDIKAIYKEREFTYKVNDTNTLLKTVGVETINANYYICKMRDEFRIMRADVLNGLIENCSFRTVLGKVLIPIDVFKEYSKTFDY